MVAIRMTLSRGRFGVGTVMVGWSSALPVSVPMRSSLQWSSDSGCPPVLRDRSYRCRRTGPAHNGGVETSVVEV